MKTRTVLIVDDDKIIREQLEKELKRNFFNTLLAADGKTALERLSENKVDILILDVKLPDMDGLEVLQKVKEKSPACEVIVVTGFGTREIAVQSLRRGAIDYIDKLNEELERRIKERSQELSQTQAQLIQTSKLATLGEMSAGLAHEMNQPLGGISLTARSFRKLMERDKLTEEELASGLTDIEASVKRMAKIIQHVRTFARQDSFTFIEVDLNETIEAALSLLGEQLRLHEIEVVRNFASDLPRVTGEPYQLEQVWINLITNARDAVDEKGKRIEADKDKVSDYKKAITISTRCSNQNKAPSVEVEISDNGIGIAEGKKGKIFEPFFTTKEVGKSMGLGLSISYGIIESHKGKMEVESNEDEGCEFSVLLPIERQDA